MYQNTINLVTNIEQKGNFSPSLKYMYMTRQIQAEGEGGKKWVNTDEYDD